MELEHGTLRMPGKRQRGKLKLKQSSYRTYQRDVRIVKDHYAQKLNVSGQSYGYLAEFRTEIIRSGRMSIYHITSSKRAKKRLRKYWRLEHTRDARHGCVAFGDLSRYVFNVLADLDRPI